MDNLSKEERSRQMSKVRGKDTKPELAVRSMLHRAGYRYALHRKDLPGKPDIVMPKYATVIFVHGCFWHRHEGCKKNRMPKTRKKFWAAKFERNVANDKRNARKLRAAGWSVITVWECETAHPEKLMRRLTRLLDQRATS